MGLWLIVALVTMVVAYAAVDLPTDDSFANPTALGPCDTVLIPTAVRYRQRLELEIARPLRTLTISASVAIERYQSLNREPDFATAAAVDVEPDAAAQIDRGLFYQLVAEATRDNQYMDAAIACYQSALQLLQADTSAQSHITISSVWRSRRSFIYKRLTKLLLFARPPGQAVAMAEEYVSITENEYAQRAAIASTNPIPESATHPPPNIQYYDYFFASPPTTALATFAWGLPPDWHPIEYIVGADRLEALISHAVLRLRGRDVKTAARLLERAIVVMPNSTLAMAHLAMCYRLLPQPRMAESLAYFRRLKLFTPTDELDATSGVQPQTYGSALREWLSHASDGGWADFRNYHNRVYVDYREALVHERSERVVDLTRDGAKAGRPFAAIEQSVAADPIIQSYDVEMTRASRDAARRRIWPSPEQRIPGGVIHHLNDAGRELTLTARPFWQYDQLPERYQKYVKLLESNWKLIRNELKPLLVRNPILSSHFDTQTEVSLPADQYWKQLPLWWKGVRNDENCRKFPKTCKLMAEHFLEATSNFGGFIKFSALTSGTSVPQHCGPHNARLRMHLGVIIPNNRAMIRVNGTIGSWEAGRVLIIDDSFEHSVWYTSDDDDDIDPSVSPPRVILIVDVWHPDLPHRFRRDSSLGQPHPHINYDYLF